MDRRTIIFRIVWLLAVALGCLLPRPSMVAAAPTIVINEVAWAGTAASSNDEWIELYNAGDATVDLAGWQLRAADGSPTIALSGALAPGGFLLLERSDDQTVADIPAALIYSGALNNQGERLELLDAQGQVVDAVNADGGPWPAGSAGPDFRSMERIDPTAPAVDANWASNDGIHRCGHDAAGNPINGTPGAANSTLAGPPPTEPPTATTAPSPSPTPTDTPTPWPTATPSPTAPFPTEVAPTATPTVAHTQTPQVTAIATDTATPSVTPTSLVTQSPPTPLAPTATPTDTATPWVTITPILTGSPTAIAPTAPATVTATPGVTITPILTGSPTAIAPTATTTALPTATAEMPTPTATATAPVPTGAHLLIYEVLYDAPQAGQDAAYEWVEIYNPNDVPVALMGWRLADNSAEDALSEGTIPARGLIVIAANEAAFRQNEPTFTGALIALADGRIGGGLGNDGDRLALLDPTGAIVDALSYGSDTTFLNPAAIDAPAGHSVERLSDQDTDTAADWTDRFPPSPGERGTLATPTATATALPSATASFSPEATPSLTPEIDATPTVSATATPSPTPSPSATASPSPTPTATLSPTPTLTPTIVPDSLRLNEFLPAPRRIDWDGDGAATAEDEWIELYNIGPETIDLKGWQLDDVAEGGSAPFTIPDHASLAPGETALFFRRDTRVALNNDADCVRLLAPDGSLRDEYAYLHARADVSFARTVDGIGGWTDAYPPSPGSPNQPPTPTPTPTPVPRTVFLNEVLPSPRDHDWDGDGRATTEDEWVEIINLGDDPVNLEGWMLDDIADGGSRPYTFPPGSVIAPGGYRLVFRAESGVALNNQDDQARLLAPNGEMIDLVAWSANPGYDLSGGRYPDGDGPWHMGLPPSPGEPNRLPEAPPHPSDDDGPSDRDQGEEADSEDGAEASGAASSAARPVISIAQARAQADGARVRVRGQVIVPPDVFERSLYIQDASGGLLIYWSRPSWPALQIGDWVEVAGTLDDFHGERELKVRRARDVIVLGPGDAPAPIVLRCDQVGEPYEGMLVMVAGAVSGFSERSLRLRDSTGDVVVYVREGLPWKRPWVEHGEWWSAIGVVSQYLTGSSSTEGYRLLPRFADDLARAPDTLPEIGAAVSDEPAPATAESTPRTE